MNSEAVIKSIIVNTIMFIPLGFFVAKMKSYTKKFILILVVLIGIEVIQYIFSLGIANINDVIFGFLGSLIGMLINSNKLLNLRINIIQNIVKKINKLTIVSNK